MKRSKSLRILTLIFMVLIVAAGLCACAYEEPTRQELVDITNNIGQDDTLISFPGLGIEPFVVNRVAFSLGKITVYWYGILITSGIVLAFLYALYRCRKNESIKTDDLLDVGIWAVVCAMVGARLYYVLTSLDRYDSFWDVFKIWEGGIAIYGAIIGGGIAVYIVCRIKKLKFLKLADTIAPGVMIGQIIGRWGNFFNGEAYGYAVSENSALSFIRMGIYPYDTTAVSTSDIIAYVHPTFLYESLWNLVGLIIINAHYRKKKFDGQIFFMYITWYGFGRMFIEMLRTDSLYIGSIRISVLVGCLCFVAGIALMIWGAGRGKAERLAGAEYENTYPLFHKKAPAKKADAEEAVGTEQQTLEDMKKLDGKAPARSDADGSEEDELERLDGEETEEAEEADGENESKERGDRQ